MSLAIIFLDIKIQHTVFALPFAVMSAFLAAGGMPEVEQLLWIMICMVCARSAAMAFNRIVDARFDAKNPRTCERALPSGQVGIGSYWAFLIASSILFIFSAWMLNSLAFYLSCLDRVSVPVWPITLSGRLTIVALVGYYPANKLMVRELIYKRSLRLLWPHHIRDVVLFGISATFVKLSRIHRQIIHVLLTLAPLYRFPEGNFLVRLACVRHAASVRSEPGSNSPVIKLENLIQIFKSK